MNTVMPTITLRFIPGFAGNAAICVMFLLDLAVYPRLRGERVISHLQIVLLVGLSPASRGTRLKLFIRPLYDRFIPGFAGNACFSSLGATGCPVYPRLRGERAPVVRKADFRVGLSPASRGTLLILRLILNVTRFIPGFAGNAGCCFYP